MSNNVHAITEIGKRPRAKATADAARVIAERVVSGPLGDQVRGAWRSLNLDAIVDIARAETGKGDGKAHPHPRLIAAEICRILALESARETE